MQPAETEARAGRLFAGGGGKAGLPPRRAGGQATSLPPRGAKDNQGKEAVPPGAAVCPRRHGPTAGPAASPAARPTAGPASSIA